MLLMHHTIVMVVVLKVWLEDFVDKVERIDRLQQTVFLALAQLTDVCLSGVEEYSALELRSPRQLHFNNELTATCLPATHINDAVLACGCAWSHLGWQVFDGLNLLALLQWEQGIKQTHHQVRMLAEYLLEGQVGFRV